MHAFYEFAFGRWRRALRDHFFALFGVGAALGLFPLSMGLRNLLMIGAMTMPIITTVAHQSER